MTPVSGGAWQGLALRSPTSSGHDGVLSGYHHRPAMAPGATDTPRLLQAGNTLNHVNAVNHGNTSIAGSTCLTGMAGQRLAWRGDTSMTGNAGILGVPGNTSVHSNTGIAGNTGVTV